jgi:hypothetical protein
MWDLKPTGFRLENLKGMLKKKPLFWDIKLYSSLKVNGLFEGIYHLHL